MLIVIKKLSRSLQLILAKFTISYVIYNKKQKRMLIVIKKLSRSLQLILAKFTISYVIYNKKQKRMLIVIKKLSRRLQLILAKGLAASIAFGFAKGLSLDLAYHNHHRNINLISTYRIFFSFFTI